MFGATNSSTVIVTAGQPTQEQIPAGFPFCMVLIGTGTPDPDDPQLIEQEFSIMTGVNVGGDPLGEFAMIGSSVSELGKSAGRGIAEVQEKVRAAIDDLTGIDGAKLLVSSTSIDTPTPLVGGHFVIDSMTVTGLCTSALHYAAPQQLAKSGTSWTWQGATHCRGRFDFKQYRLGHVAGSTPTADPDDATIVESPVTTEAITHTGLSGKAYSIYADYSSRKQTNVVEGSSDGTEVGSYLTT